MATEVLSVGVSSFVVEGSWCILRHFCSEEPSRSSRCFPLAVSDVGSQPFQPTRALPLLWFLRQESHVAQANLKLCVVEQLIRLPVLQATVLGSNKLSRFLWLCWGLSHRPLAHAKRAKRALSHRPVSSVPSWLFVQLGWVGGREFESKSCFLRAQV